MAQEAGGPALLVDQPPEEARQQEEDGHSESMADPDEGIDGPVGRAILDRPGPRHLHERDGSVEEQPEQHRRRAAGVESVESCHADYITTIARPTISPRSSAAKASLTWSSR